MPFTIVRENIVSLRTDAVVNPAIPSLTEEDGVNAEIYAAAGRRLAAACGRIGHCEVGRSVLTPGYSLPAKYIIHTVGPVWDGGNGAGTLEAAYRSALELAWKKGCGSVAIPLLSVGGYGCPADPKPMFWPSDFRRQKDFRIMAAFQSARRSGSNPSGSTDARQTKSHRKWGVTSR